MTKHSAKREWCSGERHRIVDTKDQPLVSVITATYNRDKYLPFAIESVLKQTHANIEYHIVDDGSADNTTELVKTYMGDDRIRYYFQPNQGQSVARNVGIRHSRGDFICFLDSDNVWKANKVQMQLLIFKENDDIDIVYGDGEYIDESGNLIGTPRIRRYSGYITEKLLRKNFVGFNTAMARRRCFDELGGLDETLRRSDDYELWLRFSTRYKFHYIPVCMAQYRVWNNQLSSAKEERYKAIGEILQRFFERHREYATRDRKKRTWSHFHVQRGRSRLANGKYAGAFSDYLAALSHSPMSMGPWRFLARMLLRWK